MPKAIEGRKLPLDAEARAVLVRMADGDGRAALTLAEEVWRAAREGEIFNAEQLQDILQRRAPIYDKSADGHYNLISALHKSVRGSDPDAALYYLARMMDAGEDPLFLARRVVRMAVEDIGLADPQALVICNAAKDAYDFLGHPEGELAIAQAVIYLATAPKSNAAYKAFGAAMRAAKEGGSLLPPKHILNSPTKLMKSEGYGGGYEYDHDTPEAFSGQDYFPEALGRQTFYDPPDRGFEREIRKRLDYWAKLRRERGMDQTDDEQHLTVSSVSIGRADRISSTWQKGLKVAIAYPGRAAPRLEYQSHKGRWSRSEVMRWIENQFQDRRALIGLRHICFWISSASASWKRRSRLGICRRECAQLATSQFLRRRRSFRPPALLA